MPQQPRGAGLCRAELAGSRCWAGGADSAAPCLLLCPWGQEVPRGSRALAPVHGASRLLVVMASRSACGPGKAMIFMKKKAAGLGYEQGPRTAPLFYVGLIKS